ncbi:hypothetical protein BKP37_15445 [Anaerobacillus alkalilacustris]|uniref:Uncharacterized protein n=1 Tax=Anaerobacillus alkalilacustris TaxID=393763 RepID=A0A1S2LH39_9BACI|nr:hypothetical protein [Anaerobacillus alkalilacustris]OIJ11829.1 hypothetical protein BKP37_15445 [Anaerobacillus alkalilacustris]
MKKQKKAGDNISLKTKKTEAVEVLDWINCQLNLMDSIRYLIENEIKENGIRNLQNFIPANRDISGATLSAMKAETANGIVNQHEIASTIEEQTDVQPPMTIKQTEITQTHEKDMSPSTEDEADEDIDDDDIESWV